MELLTWKQDKKVVRTCLLGKADQLMADSTVISTACGLRLPCPSFILMMCVDLQVWWYCAETKRGSRC